MPLCIHGEENCGRCMMEALNAAPVHVAIILDTSPSMSSNWDQTVSGFDEYIDSLRREQEVKYLISMTTFDRTTRIIRTEVEPDSVPKLKNSDIEPGGSGTALYDAVGETLDKIHTSDPVLVVIITDGEENSSRKWTQEGIRKLTEERQKQGNYTFTYLGAAQEAWGKEQAFGTAIAAGNAARFNAQDRGAAFSNLIASNAAYSHALYSSRLGAVSAGRPVVAAARAVENFYNTPVAVESNDPDNPSAVNIAGEEQRESSSGSDEGD